MRSINAYWKYSFIAEDIIDKYLENYLVIKSKAMVCYSWTKPWKNKWFSAGSLRKIFNKFNQITYLSLDDEVKISKLLKFIFVWISYYSFSVSISSCVPSPFAPPRQFLSFNSLFDLHPMMGGIISFFWLLNREKGSKFFICLFWTTNFPYCLFTPP